MVERLTPGEAPDPQMEEEHLARYRYAAQFVIGKRVLDVACGTGYGSRMLAEAGAASVLGVDLSPEAVNYATRHYPHAHVGFQRGDAQKLACLHDDSLDAVVSFETLEHLPDPHAYLRNVRRVLRPGGEYIVSTPDRRPGPVLAQLRNRPANPYHVHEYTRRELAILLRRYFEVVEWQGQGFVNPLLCFWPLHAVISGLGVALGRWGGRRLTHRWYYRGSGTAVEPLGRRRLPIARYWVVRCRKPIP